MESPSSEKDRDNDSQSTGNEDDDDSVEGSMSVQSEEIAGTEDTEETDEDDDDSDDDTIPPEVLPDELPMDIPPQNIQEMKPNPPESWPTLEILPGGVIKHAEKDEDDPGGSYQTAPETDPIDDSGEMMYACAKCPQRFKYLFCLVKHVRWHEDQKKKEEGPDLSKLRTSDSSSSSAHISPLLDIGDPKICHSARSSASLFQPLPAVLHKSSLHRVSGRPALRLPIRGLLSRTRLPQRLSVLRQIWPVHCHSSLSMR